MPTGVLAGVTSRVPLGDDGPDLASSFAVGDARWYPIDGGEPTVRGDQLVSPDDVLLLVTDEPELTVHMAWYSISIDVGPYRVSGRLATHPGYDPAKAVSRPGGAFVGLREATIELLGRPAAGLAERAYLHVNRYAVEAATSSLMLGFYFPGARLTTSEPVAAV